MLSRFKSWLLASVLLMRPSALEIAVTVTCPSARTVRPLCGSPFLMLDSLVCGNVAHRNAFVEAKVPIEKAKQFAPSTESATWRSDALMSNEDRMKIMMLVRDGHMTVGRPRPL